MISNPQPGTQCWSWHFGTSRHGDNDGFTTRPIVLHSRWREHPQMWMIATGEVIHEKRLFATFEESERDRALEVLANIGYYAP